MVLFKNQNYHELKKIARKEKQLFTDPEFRPNDAALGLSSSGERFRNIEWKRPKDICADPRLFVEGVNRNDLIQGELGNCWFVAACSCLANHKVVWQKVIPDHKEQEWDRKHPEKYAGIFHFHFWRYGEWLDVVIDDFLPTRDSKLVYVHSTDSDEFWSALVEKAYAKLCGSYEDLDGGELSEALEDFTAGVAEPVDLVAGGYAQDTAKREELYKTVMNASSNNALLAAAIPATTKDEMETCTRVGLVRGHAYGITAVRRVAIEGSGLLGLNFFNQDKLSMVRLRNPWGGCEWKGAFSDGSEEWRRISRDSRQKIGLTFDDDGEFWMSFEDFCEYFENLAICRVPNMHKTWHECVIHSEWKSPHLVGGCLLQKGTFLNNPQMMFDIREDGEEAMFSLTQKISHKGSCKKKTAIGFTIMKVEINRVYRVQGRQEIVKTTTFKDSRSVFLRLTLARGRYVLVACTHEKGVEASNMLRIYTKKELPKDKCVPGMLDSVFNYMSCGHPSPLVTRVKVLRAEGLDQNGGADLYALIKCEGQVVTSHVIQNTVQPEWNVAAVFYRVQPENPIVVEIWNKKSVRDQFMGLHEFPATNEELDKVYEFDLFGRKQDRTRPKRYPGRLFLQITSSKNVQIL